jgi:hypothetical protein
MTTSTVYTTNVYTVTKCPPTVTNCPTGKVVTETIPLYTTVCPVTGTQTAPKPTGPPANGPETITTKYTTVYTVTKCPPTVTNCPVGKVVTEVRTTTYCPGQDGQPPKPTGSAGGNKPSAPGSDKPTGPAGGDKPAQSTGSAGGDKPTGPAGGDKPAKSTGSAGGNVPQGSKTSEAPKPTGPAGSVPKPSVPVVASNSTIVTIPNKPTGSTPAKTSAPASGGAKVGFSVAAVAVGVLVAVMM